MLTEAGGNHFHFRQGGCKRDEEARKQAKVSRRHSVSEKTSCFTPLLLFLAKQSLGGRASGKSGKPHQRPATFISVLSKYAIVAWEANPHLF